MKPKPHATLPGLALLLLVLITGNIQAQIITTLVGNGIAGFSGDGMVSSDPEFNSPTGVAVDRAGNIYIADEWNMRIRKVSPAGIITTFAGTGTGGYSGDGGPATAAMLNRPQGVAVDTAGNVYIADTYNQRIRRVDATTGIITALAGNGFDTTIYSSTFGSYSGDGGPADSAGLNDPAAVTLDAAGNVYIADTYNHRIRKINASNGVITTIAGNGVYGYSGDNAGADSAQISDPAGIAVDGSGNVYFSDAGNGIVRVVIASTGVIINFAGGGNNTGGNGEPATEAWIGNPEGLALDGQRNLYIIDNYHQILLVVYANTGRIYTLAGSCNIISSNPIGDGHKADSAYFNYPSAVAVDTSGNIYIADEGNERIRKISSSTGIINTVAGDGILGFAGDGGPAISSVELNGPKGIALDSSGNIYISDYYNNRIRKLSSTTGIINTIAGTGANGFSGDGGAADSAELNEPWGIAIDDSGNIFIADAGNSRIRKISAATGIITTIAGNGNFGFSGDGGPAVSAQLNEPAGVAVDKSGNVYIADEWNMRIRKVSPDGIITTIAGTGFNRYGQGGESGDGGPADSADLNYPAGVTTDDSGNIYITDMLDGAVRKMTVSTGIISGISFSGWQASGLALDITGNIYVAGGTENVVPELNDEGGQFGIIGNGNAGYSGDGGLAFNAELNNPTGVALDAAGNIYIADFGNNAVRKVGAVPLAVPDVPSINAIRIYPNPTSGQVTVALNGNNCGGIRIFDLAGQKVYNHDSAATESQQNLQINLGGVENGMYIIQVLTDNGTTSKRIIVQR